MQDTGIPVKLGQGGVKQDMPLFASSPHKEEAMQSLRGGMDLKEAAKRFNISEKTAGRYLKEIQNPKPPKQSKESKDTVQKQITQGPVPAGGFTTGGKPPVMFDLGQELIPLRWQPLYEAYRYYNDLKLEEGITDDFGDFLLWSARDVWKRFRVQTRISNDKVLVEVNDGDDGRPGEEKGGG
jgi:hypothetical protein